MALSNLASWMKMTPSACGAACGASDKPEETPAACGASDKTDEVPDIIDAVVEAVVTIHRS